MKVCHLIYSGFGGSSDLALSLIEEDKKKNFSHYIQFYGPKLNIENKKKSENQNIEYKFIKKYYFFIDIISSLFNLFMARPNVILLHNFLIFPCIIYKFFFFRTKIIFINHTPNLDLTWKNKFVTFFDIFINKYVLLNNDTYKFFTKKYKINKKKLLIIQNAINIKFFSKKKKIKTNFFKIGMACRLDAKQKRYNLILKALLSKKLKDLKIKFTLAGSGQDLENFRKKVHENNLSKKIILEGYLNHIKLRRWYNSLDLYVHASNYEGMSISILQAMSMKLPTIGSKVSGIENLLGKKKFMGKTFKNTTTDIAENIKYFYLMNKSLKNKYIKTQYDYVTSNNSSQIIFKKYKELINELITN